MGMYDYINEEQVKCFYGVYFNKNFGLCTSGGDLLSFKTGDVVKTCKLHYNYSDNFAIVVEEEGYTTATIHIIKDKKVFKTVSLSDIKEADLEGINTFIDYYGGKLNISSVEDIKQFLKDNLAFSKTTKKLEKAHINLSNKFTKISWEINDEKNPDKKSKLEKEFKKTMDDYDKAYAVFEAKIEPLRNKLHDKWENKENKAEELFGCYLTTFLKNNPDDEISDDFQALINTFYEFIMKNEGIVDRYINWLEFDESLVKELEKALNDLVIPFIKKHHK